MPTTPAERASRILIARDKNLRRYEREVLEVYLKRCKEYMMACHSEASARWDEWKQYKNFNSFTPSLETFQLMTALVRQISEVIGAAELQGIQTMSLIMEDNGYDSLRPTPLRPDKINAWISQFQALAGTLPRTMNQTASMHVNCGSSKTKALRALTQTKKDWIQANETICEQMILNAFWRGAKAAMNNYRVRNWIRFSVGVVNEHTLDREAKVYPFEKTIWSLCDKDRAFPVPAIKPLMDEDFWTKRYVTMCVKSNLVPALDCLAPYERGRPQVSVGCLRDKPLDELE